MTDEAGRYADWRAVEMAIKSAAKKAHQADRSRLVDDLIRQAYHDRFLSRVFSDGDASEWVLKGGSGMLARVPNARRTLDADLYQEGYDKERALADLRRLAEVDLGDFFTFTYREHHTILTDDLQPYADGYRVTFEATLGPKPVDAIKVDLSTHVGATQGVTVTEPANRLPLPRLMSNPYRLYPLPEQIADKVCATLADHNGRPSSREKDLVDLVIIALTQTVDADQTSAAIQHEARMRRIALPERFTLPTTWGAAYTKLARNTSAARHTFDDAQALVSRFVDPVLAGTVAGAAWNLANLAWESADGSR